MKCAGMLIGALLMLQGCTYAISSTMTDKVDKTITFEMLRTDPDLYKGKMMVLGGTISQITNGKRGTFLSVEQKPLDIWGKPQRTSRTGGRFLIFTPRHLDTFTYAPGKEVTCAAEVAGTTLDKKQYDDPVLLARELKPWPQTQKSRDPQTRWGDPLYETQRQPY